MVQPSTKDGSNLRKRKKQKDSVDRISVLPDEILIMILSGLPVKDAQATSILSRRWRYMWTYSTTLNFDAEKIWCRMYELSRIFPEAAELKKRRYVEWVDSVLKLHRALKIVHFRVSYDIGPISSIGEWFQFAMKKGVEVLELDFSEYPILSPSCTPVRYALHQNVVVGSALSPLCSGTPSQHPCEYVGFKSLKVLDFKSVNVNGFTLEYVLSNCPVLERLSVSDSSTLVHLRVIGPSGALKYLAIKRCYKLKRCEISDASLVSFTYGADKIDLHLNNVPLLVETSLSACSSYNFLDVASKLSCCLSRLEILKLNNMSLIYTRDSVFPILPNLKHLELAFNEEDNDGLLQLASFMKASPLLHTLVLQLESLSSITIKRPFPNKRAAKFSHQYLKVVEFVRYCATRRQDELVKYVTKTAVKLEKIVFDPVHRDRHPTRVDKLLVGHGTWSEERSRSKVRKLKRQLLARIEVVCL